MTAGVLDQLIDGLRANSCTVTGPMGVDDARAAIVARASGLVACNGDVGVGDIVAALRAAGREVMTPDDPEWAARLASAAVGITGARLAVANPAAIALEAAPGSPRATSLVPPEHVCAVPVAGVVASLAEAMHTVAAGDLPSALTWIGGPSRTGDLEMINTLGVHGPRAVEVVLLE